MVNISVIVPVYKVEKYINRCIDSILAQTITDFELILVDDGSPDNCGTICDEYAAKDGRIKVIHQKNAGVSVARNAGLRIAHGEYIAFIDSDDYVASDWLQGLLDTAVQKQCELVLSGFTVCEENGTPLSVIQRRTGEWLLSSNEDKIEYIINNVLYCGNGWEVWTSLFDKRIIDENGIRFCEKCDNFAEDLGFMLEYLLCCHSVLAITECNYYYVQHDGSMMANSKGKVKLNSLNEVAIQFGKRFFETIKTHKDRSRYAIIYYLIMWNQYSKMKLYGEECKEALEISKKITNIKWHDKWMQRLVYHRKELANIIGKREAKIAILSTRLLYHRNWKLYVLESTIAWKIFIR